MTDAGSEGGVAPERRWQGLGDTAPPTLQGKLETMLGGETSLDAGTFLGLAERVAQGAMKEGQKLVVSERKGDELELEIRSAGVMRGGGRDSRPYGRITVHIEADPEKARRFLSVVLDPDSVVVIQSKVLFVIPITPKQIVGWKTYHQFLRELRAALKQEDPTAEAEVLLASSLK